MATEPEGDEASSSKTVENQPRLLSDDEKSSKGKRYYAHRDATKVYLLEQHARWRDLKNELKAKTDSDLACLLLDHYTSNNAREFR